MGNDNDINQEIAKEFYAQGNSETTWDVGAVQRLLDGSDPDMVLGASAHTILREIDKLRACELAAILEVAGERFAGDDVNSAARDWAETGLTIERVRAWVAAGCWDPDVAADLSVSGCDPSDLSRQGMYAVCNGDLSFHEAMNAEMVAS